MEKYQHLSSKQGARYFAGYFKQLSHLVLITNLRYDLTDEEPEALRGEIAHNHTANNKRYILEPCLLNSFSWQH